MQGAQVRLNLPDPLGGSARRNRLVVSGCFQADGLLVEKTAKVAAKRLDRCHIVGRDLDDEGGDGAAFEVALGIDDGEAVEGR